MTMHLNNEADRITAFLVGEIDHHALNAVRGELDSAIEFSLPKLLILDFSGVSYMDSSGIGLILGRAKLMKNYGGSIQVKNTNPTVTKIIKLAGLGGMISAGKA